MRRPAAGRGIIVLALLVCIAAAAAAVLAIGDDDGPRRAPATGPAQQPGPDVPGDHGGVRPPEER